MPDNKTYKAIPTELGLTKIQHAEFEGVKLALTYLDYGDGGGDYYIPDPTQTELKHKIDRTPINGVEQDDIEHIAWVKATIRATNKDCVVREVGLIDTDGDLIFIANTPEIDKVAISQGALVDIPLDVGIKQSYMSSITIELPEGDQYITKTYGDTHYADVDFTNVTQTAKDTIKEIAEGPLFYDEKGDAVEFDPANATEIVLKDKEDNYFVTAGSIFYEDYEEDQPKGKRVVLEDKDGNKIFPYTEIDPDGVTILKNEKKQLMTDLTYKFIKNVNIDNPFPEE